MRHLKALLVILGLVVTAVCAGGCDGGDSTAAPEKPDKSAPTTPEEVNVSNVTARRVTLRWIRSEDDKAVERYVVRRNGIDLAEVPAGTPRHTVRGLEPDTEYGFTIAAVDAAGNRSKESTPVFVTTEILTARQRLVFRSVADAYVTESRPFNTYGIISKKLRMDGKPVRRSYLRFEVTGLKGRVTDAILLLYARSGSSRGYFVRGIEPVPWYEASITYATSPVATEERIARSGPFPPETWTRTSIKPLVSSDGPVNIALTTDDVTLIGLASREDVKHAPRLVVRTIRPLDR
jgi:hypothetical protein